MIVYDSFDFILFIVFVSIVTVECDSFPTLMVYVLTGEMCPLSLFVLMLIPASSCANVIASHLCM